MEQKIKNREARLSHGDAAGRRIVLDVAEAALERLDARERIRSIAAEHGMTLNDAQTQQLADLFRKIQSIGGSNFAERVQDLPETVEKIRESGENALSTAGTVWDSVRGFFRSVAKTLSAIFGG